MEMYKENIAERGFDPRTSGLWAQHASAAPHCFHMALFLLIALNFFLLLKDYFNHNHFTLQIRNKK